MHEMFLFCVLREAWGSYPPGTAYSEFSTRPGIEQQEMVQEDPAGLLLEEEQLFWPPPSSSPDEAVS